jgi:hypothetical protein
MTPCTAANPASPDRTMTAPILGCTPRLDANDVPYAVESSRDPDLAPASPGNGRPRSPA